MNSLQSLYSMKSSKTQEGVYETFYHGYDMHNTTQIKYNTKKQEANMKTCIVGNIHPKPTKSIQQTQQNIHKPYSTSYFQNSTKTQNPRNQGLETKIHRENDKTHTFS